MDLTVRTPSGALRLSGKIAVLGRQRAMPPTTDARQTSASSDKSARRSGRGNDPPCQHQREQALGKRLQRHEISAEALRMGRARDQLDRDGDHRPFDQAGQRSNEQDAVGACGIRHRVVERRKSDQQHHRFHREAARRNQQAGESPSRSRSSGSRPWRPAASSSRLDPALGEHRTEQHRLQPKDQQADRADPQGGDRLPPGKTADQPIRIDKRRRVA